MSQSGLLTLELASIEWQQSISEAQQSTAHTVQVAATVLTAVYEAAQAALDKLMQKDTKDDQNAQESGHYHAANGKPTYYGSKDNTYSSRVQLWQTYYNLVSQGYQNIENSENTPIQALDQQTSSLGNSSQEASQFCAVAAKPNGIVASLLQSTL